MSRVYACIDLKSFYASVECVERNLDPLNTNLVVCDVSKTEKTICLAVTPSLKEYGLSGRSRLYQVLSVVKSVNKERLFKSGMKKFLGKSFFKSELVDNRLEVDFIKAKPRMKLYMKYSSDIYNIYLKYFSSEDILVYSIDEVFCDITDYLKLYDISSSDLITKVIEDVYKSTGITATAGIGSNMYLAKVAMDITAKKMEPNSFGVRLAELDVDTYKRTLWDHKPITDFWNVGKGYADRLRKNNMYTMGDVARMSIDNERLLYKLFGVNAEYLIDHAWGIEECTIKDVKNYRPENNSISRGQVLKKAYDYNNAKLIVREMTELLVLDLVKSKMYANSISLMLGYDKSDNYDGQVVVDVYGRVIPKPARGSMKIENKTNSKKVIMDLMLNLYEKIVNKNLFVKRVSIGVGISKELDSFKQLNLFEKEEEKDDSDDEIVSNTIIEIQNKYGKNAILKGMNFKDGATTIIRNDEVGGHKA